MNWRKPLSIQRARFWRRTVGLSFATWFVGWFLMVFVDVETIIGSGPILFCLGIVLLIIQWPLKTRSMSTVLLGMLNIILPILFTTMIPLFDLSPDDAELPFGILGTIAIFFAFALTVLSWQQSQSMRQKWQCQRCGYPLIKLQSNTCPECGTMFNPLVVKMAAVDAKLLGD